MKQITVFIVDDSQVAREHLQYIIEQDPQLTVIGSAENGEKAMKWLEKNKPDVITMDIRMPNIDGFEVTRRIMQCCPTPIIIVSGTYNSDDAEQSFNALEAGALAILEKPVGGIFDKSDSVKTLKETIKAVAGIKLITRRAKFLKSASSFDNKVEVHKQIEAIAIGASLGGPPALCSILSKLSSSIAVPIFIVQHIVPGFIEGLARWLRDVTTMPIHIPKEGEIALPGHVYLAPDHCHMLVKPSGKIVLLKEGATAGPQPSVGKLFQSISESYGAHAVGVLLTGMGQDGAKELLLMRKNGAITIAQDEESSIMFGMPKEAILMGAAKLVLPLEQIAAQLISLTQRGDQKSGH